ncbi:MULTISPECIES: hypothetical protein [unclassified Streptomyces]
MRGVGGARGVRPGAVQDDMAVAVGLRDPDRYDGGRGVNCSVSG